MAKARLAVDHEHFFQNTFIIHYYILSCEMGKAGRSCWLSFQAEETKAKFPQHVSGSGRLRTQLSRLPAPCSFGKWHECQLLKLKNHPETRHLLLLRSSGSWWLVLLCSCCLCAHRAWKRQAWPNPLLSFQRALLSLRCCWIRREKPWRSPAGWSAARVASVTPLTTPWRRWVCVVSVVPLGPQGLQTQAQTSEGLWVLWEIVN